MFFKSVVLLSLALAQLCGGEETGGTCDFSYTDPSTVNSSEFPPSCTFSRCNSSCSYRTYRTCLCYSHNEELVKSDWIMYFALAVGVILTVSVVPLLMFFNINVVSGPKQSFVFFYQCLPLVTPRGKFLVYLVLQNQLYDSPAVRHPLSSRFYFFEYFKYIFVAMEIFLVLFLVKCSWCPLQKCRLPWAKTRRAVRNFREKHVPKHSVIHGICSVVLLAYGDLLAISSLAVLNAYRTCCYDIDGGCPNLCVKMDALKEIYSYSHGSAFIAFTIVLSVIVLLLLLSLPLSLIYYPTIPALFHKLTKRSLPRFPKLDPVFDVFQGVYKEKLRWYAGVHLLYRVFLWIMHVGLFFDPNLQNFIILTLLVIILAIHSFFQPYKAHKHNYIETLYLIYLVLIAAINQLGLFITRVYSEGAAEEASRVYLDSVSTIVPKVFSYLTLVLGLLPIIGLLLMFVYKHCLKNRHFCQTLSLCSKCGQHSSQQNDTTTSVKEEVPYHAEW